MNTVAPHPSIKRCRDLYEVARYLDAYAEMSNIGVPEKWENLSDRILAGRLLQTLGDEGRATRLFRTAMRMHPDSPEAFYYYASTVERRHGPFEALRLVHDWLGETTPQPGQLSYYKACLYLTKARLLGAFRDFDERATWRDAGLTALAGEPWAHVEAAVMMEQEDRYAEALEHAQAAYRIRSDFRPSCDMLAHCLLLSNRPDEAVTVLEKATQSMQSAHMFLQLGILHMEAGNQSRALEDFINAERCLPLAEKGRMSYILKQKADALYLAGRHGEAVKEADSIKGDYYKNFSEKVRLLPEGSQPLRKVLPVGFTRQHHVTCAPATVSAVSTYLGCPIDHLELASVITYDGTTCHEERHWLETHGWHVREFTLTREIAETLIDLNIPFTLTVNWVRQAHLQAVIGYDRTLGTLIIRDPYIPTQLEVWGKEFLKEQAPFGPRAMVLLPEKRAGEIADIPFPDAGVYDAYFGFRRSLVEYNRQQASEFIFRMEEIFPEHNLVLIAKIELAGFDGNTPKIYELGRQFRERYPEEQNALLNFIGTLQFLGYREELSTLLAESADNPKMHPAFWQIYCEILRSDDRKQQQTLLYARRLLRKAPLDSANLSTFANVLWDQKNFDQAYLLYRLAACSGNTIESHWQSFFAAARYLKREDEVLQLMQNRLERFGGKSGQPALTLEGAFGQTGKINEGIKALEHAIELRPTDGQLLLAMAETQARIGNFPAADSYLKKAEDCIPHITFLRSACRISVWKGDNQHALDCSQQFLDISPLDTEMLAENVRLTRMLEGVDAEQARLEELCRRFPNFVPLVRIRLESLRESNPTKALSVAEEFLASNPDDAWVLREKALLLDRNGNKMEAWVAAEKAETLEASAPSAGTVGLVYLSLGEKKKAYEAFARGIRRSVDEPWLMYQLMHTCVTFAEKQAAIFLIKEELGRQLSLGHGYLGFREIASGLLPPEETEKTLLQLLKDNPAHWQIHSACIKETLTHGKLDKARDIAEKALERFPLYPALWLDKADVHRLSNEPAAEVESLKRGLEIYPGAVELSKRLVSFHERENKPDDALGVIEKALLHDPLDSWLLIEKARLLWQKGFNDKALACLKHALHCDPNNDYAWDLLKKETADSDTALEVAEEITGKNPENPACQLRLACELSAKDRHDEALAISEKILAKSPDYIEAIDFKAWVLAACHRYEEAINTATPAVFAASMPLQLRFRTLWIRWTRGNHAEAIEDMRELLRERPDFAAGWQYLADWNLAKGNLQAASNAAKQYAALRPGEVVSLGYTADILIRMGKESEAVEYLQKAVRLDPNYLYASSELFQIACKLKRFNEAKNALPLLRAHVSEWDALCYEIMLHCAESHRQMADSAFRKLLHTPTHETPILFKAAGIIREHLWGSLVTDACREKLGDPKINPAVGTLWAESFVRENRPLKTAWLKKSKATEEVRRAAYMVYLSWLGDTKRVIDTFWEMNFSRKFLRSNDELWGMMGFALFSLPWWAARKFPWWMKDWRQRKDAPQWALWNLVMYNACRNRTALAVEIAEAAFQGKPDHAYAMHVSYLAWQYAMDGKTAESEACLAVAPDSDESNKAIAKILLSYAREINAMRSLPPEKRREQLPHFRNRMVKLENKYPTWHLDPFIVHHCLKTKVRLAQLAGYHWLAFRYKLRPLGKTLGRLGEISLIILACVAGLAVIAVMVVAGKGFPIILVIVLLMKFLRGKASA